MATLPEKKMRDLERARAGVHDKLHVQCVHFNSSYQLTLTILFHCLLVDWIPDIL